MGPVSTVADEAIDYGDGPKGNFFVIRLKDRFAEPALLAYANAVLDHATSLLLHNGQNPEALSLQEYAREILEEALNARKAYDKKIPD